MEALLELRNITKIFPGVRALNNVSYSLMPGEVSALLGENGAGKSTLIKIISGVYSQTAGEIRMNGSPVKITGPADSQRLGIGTIHQEFNLFPNLTVLENIAFSANLNRFTLRPLHYKKIREKIEAILESMDILLPLGSKVRYLTVANQQLVEIAKALMLDVKILIMDEPTAALTDREIENLFSVIRRLKRKGVSIIYISHHMNEIMELADCVTVLRDGRLICSRAREEVDEREIALMITGKDDYLDLREKQRKERRFDETQLKVEGLTLRPHYADVGFEVHKGEIFGFLGPLGAGKTEIGTTLYGILHRQSGSVKLNGRELDLRSPGEALRHGIAYISEDRKKTGIFTNMSLRQNLTLPALMLKSRSGIIDRGAQGEIAGRYVKALGIKTPSENQNINFLSGGNQQKAIVARSLATDPSVLILDQPTRGLDIGAKEEIRKLLHGLADQGMSIIVLTMEVPEAMELCDTIALLKEGRITELVRPAGTTVAKLTARMLSV